MSKPDNSVVFKAKCPSCPESMLIRITKKQLKELLKGMKLPPDKATAYYERHVGSLAVMKVPKEIVKVE